MMDLWTKQDESVGTTVPPDDHWTPVGEVVSVRDFAGRLVETIRIMSDGKFCTMRGIIPASELGRYILNVSGHPARAHSAEQVVSVFDAGTVSGVNVPNSLLA